MAGPPTRHELKNDLYSRGLKVILIRMFMTKMTIMLLVQVEEGEAGGVRLSLRSQELLLGEREVCVVFMIDHHLYYHPRHSQGGRHAK